MSAWSLVWEIVTSPPSAGATVRVIVIGTPEIQYFSGGGGVAQRALQASPIF